MQLLKTAFHPDVSPTDISSASELTLIERHAARGIVLKGEDILLLYTQRYHDYSLPGGGIDDGEDEVEGLIRELREETAFEAHEVSNGMIPRWMNIYEAIAHNEEVIANSDKKGFSIERETFMLKVIADRLIEADC